jgi:hypothetical protein
MHWIYKKLFRDIGMTSKRAKKQKIFGRMNPMVIPLKKLLNALETLLERFKKLKKILMATPPKNFVHVVMLLFLLHQSPSMDLQDSTKQIIIQRRR